MLFKRKAGGRQERGLRTDLAVEFETHRLAHHASGAIGANQPGAAHCVAAACGLDRKYYPVIVLGQRRHPGGETQLDFRVVSQVRQPGAPVVEALRSGKRVIANQHFGRHIQFLVE